MKRQNFFRVAALLIGNCVVFLPACGKKHHVARVPSAPQRSQAASRAPAVTPAKPQPVSVGYVEEGIASWYGIPYHGRPAADGEIYDMEKLVAAHRVMPFNTWLKVTNVVNGKSVNVRVIDRGPFIAGRLIDLSKAAAREIDLIGPGVGPVRLEVIAAPADIPSNDFYAVQVGAFSVYGNAERVRAVYAERFGAAQLAVKQGSVPLWRVLVGKENSIPAAQQLADRLRVEDKNVFVVRLDQTVPDSVTPPITPPAAPPSTNVVLPRTPNPQF